MKVKLLPRRLFLVSAALALAGCAHYAPSVPENYAGPRASLEDSAKAYGSSKADFFVVESINGAAVDHSLNETLRRNRGRGMYMEPYFIPRAVVAGQPVVLASRGARIMRRRFWY